MTHTTADSWSARCQIVLPNRRSEAPQQFHMSCADRVATHGGRVGGCRQGSQCSRISVDANALLSASGESSCRGLGAGATGLDQLRLERTCRAVHSKSSEVAAWTA
jgi:hypothetical protein